MSSNQYWWPDQLNLKILREKSPASDPDGGRLRLRRGGQDPGHRCAAEGRRRGDDDLARLVAGRLRPLWAALHPHDLARPPAPTESATDEAAAAPATNASRL